MFDNTLKRFNNMYRVGYIIFWDSVPTHALSDPLTDLWDHIECPVCNEVFYRLGLQTHLKTHRYNLPLWLNLLKKAMR